MRKKLEIKVTGSYPINPMEIISKFIAGLTVNDKNGRFCCLPNFKIKNPEGKLEILSFGGRNKMAKCIISISNIEENYADLIKKLEEKIKAVIKENHSGGEFSLNEIR